MKPDEKVYLAFYKSKKDVMYFNEIKEISKLSDSSLTNALRKLVSMKILDREKKKSNTFYRIRNKRLFALKFSEIALRRFNNLRTDIKVPLTNFIKNIPKEIHTIILFGSAPRGNTNKNSDIDLVIISTKKVNIEKNKREGELVSNYPLSIFQFSVKEFIKKEDNIIVQAINTGFPIYGEQYFYEELLNGYRLAFQ